MSVGTEFRPVGAGYDTAYAGEKRLWKFSIWDIDRSVAGVVTKTPHNLATYTTLHMQVYVEGEGTLRANITGAVSSEQNDSVSNVMEFDDVLAATATVAIVKLIGITSGVTRRFGKAFKMQIHDAGPTSV